MKKLIKVFLLILLLIAFFIVFRLLLAPLLDKTLTALTQPKIKSGSEFTTKETCEQNGGDWGKAGLFPKEFCRIPMTDFNKTCIAGFQCMAGNCLTQFSFNKNSFPLTSGKCPKYVTVFGCIQSVHFGFKGLGICLD